MTYTATHPPIDMPSNKGDGLSAFYGDSLHDSANDGLFDDVFDFDAAACGLFDPKALVSTESIVDFDSQSSPSTSPSFQFVDVFPDLGVSASPPPTTLHYPSFLSGITSLKTEDELSRPRSAPSGQISDKTDSPSPPSLVSSVRPSPARKVCVSDTELLKLENISLYTPKRPRVQATPTSPCPKRPNTLSRVVSFNNKNSSYGKKQQVGTAPSRSATFSSDIPLRSRATPRTASGAPRTPSPRPRAVPHRKTTPFTSGFVEYPFYKPSTAPMPPPRKPRTPQKQHGAVPKKKMVASQNFEQHTANSTLVSREQSPAQQVVPTIKTEDESAWGSPEPTSHFSSGNDGLGAWWDLPGVFDGNVQLSDTEAAAQNATLNLARYTDMGDFGYGGYSGPQLPQDGLWGGLTINIPQSRPQPPAMVQNLTLSVATLQQASSPPTTPHRRPQQQFSLSAPRHHPFHMSTPLRKVRSLGSEAGPSSSPPRGRHALGEPSMVRSTSAISCDRTVRKRKSSTRKELKPFGSPGSASTGAAGFVNFTPEDSQILLTGVAPSGSSKTKAKRDREEQERRRRLGEAALKAVEAAGGDVGLLAEETRGLLGSREGLEFD